MRTREKIKVTAIEQFNEFGATNISTIRLSNHMGISPGNYYYYFSSKEHLIRVIWEEDMLPHSNGFFFEREYAPTVKGMMNFMEAGVNHIYKYRFFYTELFILQKNDPKLLEVYRTHLAEISKQAVKIFQPWEDAGLLKFPDSVEEKERLMENMWVVAMGWVGFTESYNEKMSAKKVKEKVVFQLYSLFSSSLTADGKKGFEALLK